MASPSVQVFDDEEQLALAAAGAILFNSLLAVARRGRFHWAVAGGGTPKKTFAALAAPPYLDEFPWDRSDAWLGDERVVSADDPASNRRMVEEHLFRAAGADPGALHAFDTRKEPGPAAEDYSRELERAVPKNGGDVPVLDLVLLGLGTDTHTASWFPGSDFPEDRWAAVVEEERGGYRRLTLTPVVVNAARHVLFLVSGEAKQEALRRVFGDSRDPRSIPAQRVVPDGRVAWMLDRQAAGQFFAG